MTLAIKQLCDTHASSINYIALGRQSTGLSDSLPDSAPDVRVRSVAGSNQLSLLNR
jgi:hypothetical protein